MPAAPPRVPGARAAACRVAGPQQVHAEPVKGRTLRVASVGSRTRDVCRRPTDDFPSGCPREAVLPPSLGHISVLSKASSPLFQAGVPHGPSALARPLHKAAVGLSRPACSRSPSPDAAGRTAFLGTGLNTRRSISPLPVMTASGWLMMRGSQRSWPPGCYSWVALHSPPSASSRSSPVFPESQRLGSVSPVAPSEKVPKKLCR